MDQEARDRERVQAIVRQLQQAAAENDALALARAVDCLNQINDEVAQRGFGQIRSLSAESPRAHRRSSSLSGRVKSDSIVSARSNAQLQPKVERRDPDIPLRYRRNAYLGPEGDALLDTQHRRSFMISSPGARPPSAYSLKKATSSSKIAPRGTSLDGPSLEVRRSCSSTDVLGGQLDFLKGFADRVEKRQHQERRRMVKRNRRQDKLEVHKVHYSDQGLAPATWTN